MWTKKKKKAFAQFTNNSFQKIPKWDDRTDAIFVLVLF